jgi:hypothetical protein
MSKLLTEILSKPYLKPIFAVPTKWAKGKRSSVHEVGTGTGYKDFNGSDRNRQQKDAI